MLRRDLFHQFTISGIDINGVYTNVLYNLLLIGSHDLSVFQNKVIVPATIYFI